MKKNVTLCDNCEKDISGFDRIWSLIEPVEHSPSSGVDNRILDFCSRQCCYNFVRANWDGYGYDDVYNRRFTAK